MATTDASRRPERGEVRDEPLVPQAGGARVAPPLLGLQRTAGNRAVRALLARRGLLQRTPADDLKGGSVPIPQGQKVDLPAGTALLDVGGQRYRIPARIYEIADVPTELDHLGFEAHNRYRGVYLPGTEAEQLQELARSGNRLTIGEVRAYAARTGLSVRVAIGSLDGQLQLLGVDSVKLPKKLGGTATEGFVLTALNTRLAGRDLLIARAKMLVQQGASNMYLSVGSTEDTLAFHKELIKAAQWRRSMFDEPGKVSVEQGMSYNLEPHHLANLIAEWDRSLTPEQRSALKAAGAQKTTIDKVRAALATPSASTPAPAEPPPPPARAKPTEPAKEEPAPPSSHEPEPVNLAAEEIERQHQRGQAIGGAAIVVLGLLHEWLNSKVEESQKPLILAELANMDRVVAEHQKLNPRDGALVRLVYTRSQLPDAPTSGPRVFGWVDAGYGPTESQAANDLYRQSSISRALGKFERYEYQFQWVTPLSPTPYSELQTPFPRVGSGGIADASLTLQDVRWAVDGFDDERTSTVTFKTPQDAQFSILRPGTVKSGRYMLGESQLPVRMRQPKEGAAVEALDLDPDLPGFTTYVVPIFPDNDATREAFKSARKLKFEWPAWGLENRPNIDLVRFVRPENIRVLSRR